MYKNQPDPTIIPRYCGISTFARLNTLTDQEHCDILILGVPYDTGVTFRPGARFGPESIRQSSRLIRNFNISQNKSPFDNKVILDGGDIICNPFNIDETVTGIIQQVTEFLKISKNLIFLGGDHTISYPVLKSLHSYYGQVSLIHFDSHFDTWEEYFKEKVTHGTPFKRVLDENLINVNNSLHVGIRGSINDYSDIENDENLGYKTIFCQEIDEHGIQYVIDKIKERVGTTLCYVSIDIDVVDPAFAPGTGTPEPGGFSSRELFAILKGIKDLNVIGGDVVEVAPCYDSNNITSQLAANICYDLMCMIKTESAQNVQNI